jgi:predicted N-acetyltransferase YhbS
VVVADDEQVSVDDMVVLNKEHEQVEHVGLTLAEAKALLQQVQRQVLTRVASRPRWKSRGVGSER